MNLINFLNNLIQHDGFILIDSKSNKYVIGKPIKEKPIILKLLDKSLNYKLLLYPDLYFGEAYTNGSLVIENGTITEFLDIVLKNIGKKHINIYSKIFNKLKGTYKHLTNFNKGIKSKQNVAHHYDISEKLYDLFLDLNRQYSCAYFKNESDTLEEAQNNKIDHIIKKLNIKPNQKVLDIGSGWGTLAINIAQKTKASVTGITLSENQLEFSKNKVKELNLGNQVDFKLLDYRDLNEKYDHVASIEMIEAVGEKYMDQYFGTIKNVLNYGGTAAIQGIVIKDDLFERYRANEDFIQKYIFPGGFLPSIQFMENLIKKNDLKLEKINTYSDDYARTLATWRKNFLGAWEKISPLGFDEYFKRMWEFYLSYCEAGFKSKNINLIQFSMSNKEI